MECYTNAKNESAYNPYSTKIDLGSESKLNAEHEYYYEDGLPGNYFNGRAYLVLSADLILYVLSAIAYFEVAQNHHYWYSILGLFVFLSLYSLLTFYFICTGRICNKLHTSIIYNYALTRMAGCLLGVISSCCFALFIYELHMEQAQNRDTIHLRFVETMYHFYVAAGCGFGIAAVYFKLTQKAFSQVVGRWTAFSRYHNL